MPLLLQILCELFGFPEEINGGERCPTYLYRWTIFQWRGHISAYLHHFVSDDWSLDLHDHPKRFISIGLAGSYRETTPAGTREWKAPWLRSFPATHIHRISAPRNCWTLVFVLKPVREWGFWHDGEFIQWRRYVDGEGGHADKMKACN
jgi:hypothetical protein